jgi:hypothetical protein
VKHIKLYEDFVTEAERVPTMLFVSDLRKYFSDINYDTVKRQYDRDTTPEIVQADNGKWYEASSAYNRWDERVVKLKSVKAPKNESAVTESTIQYFKPTVIDKKNAIDAKFFKKLMPRTSATAEEAMERIWHFEDSTMFVHYQYHIVMPNGNKPDRPTYRLHQSQYWLTGAYDNQIKNLGLDPNVGVNTTLVTIFDITDPANEVNLGKTWVDTKVFLDEMNRVFEVSRRES